MYERISVPDEVKRSSNKTIQELNDIFKENINSNNFSISVSTEVYIKDAEVKAGAKGNYMNLTLMDITGEITAKIWSINDQIADKFKTGTCARIVGDLRPYNNSPQLSIDVVKSELLSNEQVDFSLLVPTAPFDADRMFNYIYKVASEIKDEDLKKLTVTLLDNNKEKLMYFPAAKRNHHSVRSGLLYHTSTMLRAADGLVKVYDFLNKDLLFAGVIVHDLSKMEEMITSDVGLVSDYSIEGNLLGHIIEGVKRIEVVGNELNINKEKIMLLEHMVLSHHYLPEYGSPKYPAFPEAEMLHYLDIIDSRMYDMKAAFDKTEPGKFSDRIFSLENRQVYHNTCF